MSSEKKRAKKATEAGLGNIGRIKILRTLSKDRGDGLIKYAQEQLSGFMHKPCYCWANDGLI